MHACDELFEVQESWCANIVGASDIDPINDTYIAEENKEGCRFLKEETSFVFFNLRVFIKK